MIISYEKGVENNQKIIILGTMVTTKQVDKSNLEFYYEKGGKKMDYEKCWCELENKLANYSARDIRRLWRR